MTRYTIYRFDTGQIAAAPEMSFSEDLRQLYLDAALAPWGADTHGLLEAGSDPALHWVASLADEPTVQDRPPLEVLVDKTEITADGIDEATLTGLPDPCEVIVDADDPAVATTVTEVTGGGFAFAAEDPGSYTIEVIRFPFLPWRVVIEATAP